MKRTVPLLITAIAGFVLIVSFFIPATEGWGEEAAIWFDILAAIAFILGGGNLMKVHLKKASDRAPGWGFSAVTLIAFLTMLTVGLLKIGAPPATIQEFLGETFVELKMDALPASQTASVDGAIPDKASGDRLPASVRQQVSENTTAGKVLFRGWMRNNQKEDLAGFKDELEWKCLVEKLFDASQPNPPLKGKVNYYADHDSIGFKGVMSDQQRDDLLAMSADATWTTAINRLYDASRRVTTIDVGPLPPTVAIPPLLKDVKYDTASGDLSVTGPLSARDRDVLAMASPRRDAQAMALQFPIARPVSGGQRAALRQAIESRGRPLSGVQTVTFGLTLDGLWTVDQLVVALNEAGRGKEQDKTVCKMLAERQQGTKTIDPREAKPADVVLTDGQRTTLQQIAAGDQLNVAAQLEQLKAGGPFNDDMADALWSFLSKQPTIGDRNKALAFALLREGPLDQAQRDYLFADYRQQVTWREKVNALFLAAHTVKYPWSGAYRAQGDPFWWLYEYAFKPLTATMFALLAFYVASAAFRAFRAKNIEAILLLGTAFIILLGRTFAGVWLTSWIPEDSAFAGLRIENLTVTIMSVFNTAGNRAIMIGIALGIASTSLKVLLGVDRSYLGKE